jgi:hypothetical protein
MRFVAAGVVAAAVAIGAYTIGDSPSANGASTPAAVAAPSPAQAPVGAPAGWRAGTGTIITGAAADKATAAAVAKYPEGTINRVLKLSDGSYAVHRIGVSTAHHIFVSEAFKVTGTS